MLEKDTGSQPFQLEVAILRSFMSAINQSFQKISQKRDFTSWFEQPLWGHFGYFWNITHLPAKPVSLSNVKPIRHAYHE